MKSAPDSLQASLHSFFEAAAADLETTVENLSVNLACLPQSRNQHARGAAKVLSYTMSVLLPTLTSLFQHLGNCNYGVELLGEGSADHRPGKKKKKIPTRHKGSASYDARFDKQNVLSVFALAFTPICYWVKWTAVSHTPWIHSGTPSPPYYLTPLKLALVKCVCCSHRAAGAYCLSH